MAKEKTRGVRRGCRRSACPGRTLSLSPRGHSPAGISPRRRASEARRARALSNSKATTPDDEGVVLDPRSNAVSHEVRLELLAFTLGPGREEHEVSRSAVAHRVDERIVCIENRVALGLHASRDHALHLGQLLQRVDTAEAEMIGADVQHDTDVHFVETESSPKETATR